MEIGQALVIRPGDTLIIAYSGDPLTLEGRDRYMSHVYATLPTSVKVLVVEACQIAVFRSGEGQSVSKCEDPHLGLATTRHLIGELKARGECEMDDRNAGGFLREHMETLLAELPSSMLGYSTVGGYPEDHRQGLAIELG